MTDERYKVLYDDGTYPKTLLEWCHAAYENSKAHGFHDHPDAGQRSRMPEKIALLHSEVSELLEACRKDPWAPTDKPGLLLSFAAEELADIVIRTFDFVIEFKKEPDMFFPERSFSDLRVSHHNPMPIPDALCEMHRTISRFDESNYAPALLVAQCAQFAATNGVDLEHAVTVKHEYNKSRPYMHGGKKF